MASTSQDQKAAHELGGVNENAHDRLYCMRHSCAHVLAQAMLSIFPDVKLGIGPVIENGFYYDFGLPRTLLPEDLKILQKKMEEICRQKQIFIRREEKIKSAIEELKAKNQPFKVDLAEQFEREGSDVVSFYENRDKKNEVKFVDLCRGGHTENTGEVGAFQLMSIASAYWRGDANNVSLQRVYGVCFETNEELSQYLKRLEEAKKRDHKVLGKSLELFMHSPLVGGGLPLFLPRGAMLKRILEDYICREKEKRGYQFVWIPHIAKDALYLKSGHLGKYDAMMPVMENKTENKEGGVEDVEGDKFVLKPMNCPHHFEIYRCAQHSYRDLPFRIAENTTVYRNEKSGEVNGLFRVRCVSQDDTHHFVRHDQIESEIDMILNLTKVVYERFDFKNYKARISIRDPKKPEKYFGDNALWEKAEVKLIDAIRRWGSPYFIGEGEAAFYGPKIDLMVEDAIRREWQLTTVQLDFTQPENFDLTYIGEDGKEHRPAVIHVAVLGSFERFMGILIEHYGGAFPAWLAPVQVRLVPVAAEFIEYAAKVVVQLRENGLRVEVDHSSDSLSKKIRKGEMMKIPYLLVVGEKEKESGMVAVRSYATKEQKVMKVDDFCRLIH